MEHMEDKDSDFLWHMKMDGEDENRLDHEKHFHYQIWLLYSVLLLPMS